MANTNKPDRERTDTNTARVNPEVPATNRFNNASATPGTQTQQGGEYVFRCADAGNKDCPWETRGSSPDEVLRNVEQHGRQQHNLPHIDEDTRNQVRSKIRQAA